MFDKFFDTNGWRRSPCWQVQDNGGLEIKRQTPYYPSMDDATKHAPAGWLEALAISEAELAAGLTVPMETILKEMDDSIANLEAMRKSPRDRRGASRQR